jgi:riboflavin synthase
MFTGLIEEVGRVTAVEDRGDARTIRISAPLVTDGLQPGDSVALDGVCLTAVVIDGGEFSAQAIGTTLGRTTLGEIEAGRRVNLERALTVGQRLGGHIVQGHVDDVGVVSAIRRQGEHVLLDVAVPDDVRDVTVLHGSIAINGVSLTVNALAANVVQVALIPYTWEHTALCDLEPGRRVNLEGDMFGKYAVEYLKRTRA